jgi:hypothetical protein
MAKTPTALRTPPSKEEVYRVFNRLLQRWPEDRLRPNRSIRSLKPMTPSNPNFDQRHYYYQSAAMKGSDCSHAIGHGGRAAQRVLRLRRNIRNGGFRLGDEFGHCGPNVFYHDAFCRLAG